MIGKTALGFALVFVILNPAVAWNDPSQRDILKDSAWGLVRITVSGRTGNGADSSEYTSNGSGVALTKSGYVITASHVIPKDGEVQDIDIEGQVGPLADEDSTRLQLVSRDEGHDTALLRFVKTPPLLRPLPFSWGDPARGDILTILGYPPRKTDRLKQETVTVSADPVPEEHRFIFSGFGNQGMSGGPMLDPGGNVVGIVSHRVDQQASVTLQGVNEGIVPDLYSPDYNVNDIYPIYQDGSITAEADDPERVDWVKRFENTPLKLVCGVAVPMGWRVYFLSHHIKVIPPANSSLADAGFSYDVYQRLKRPEERHDPSVPIKITQPNEDTSAYGVIPNSTSSLVLIKTLVSYEDSESLVPELRPALLSRFPNTMRLRFDDPNDGSDPYTLLSEPIVVNEHRCIAPEGLGDNVLARLCVALIEKNTTSQNVATLACPAETPFAKAKYPVLDY